MAAPPASPGILIVDDSEEVRSLACSILKEAGFTNVAGAASAREALTLLGGGNGRPPFEMVLMGLGTSGTDGISATSRLKADERLRDIPVILVTPDREPGNLEAAFAAGAVDYVARPLNRAELVARVRSALRLKGEIDHRKARESELAEAKRYLEEANKNLLKLASQDGLTGIANRRRFDEALAQEWRRAARDATPLGLVMADIDHFKSYNDIHGHPMGDTCLKRVAATLADTLARPADLVARYGGEEFALLLPGTDLAGTAAIAEKARAAVERLGIPHQGLSPCPGVTISAGAASLVPARGGSSAALVAAADQALYQAKHAGRNRVFPAAGTSAKNASA